MDNDIPVIQFTGGNENAFAVLRFIRANGGTDKNIPTDIKIGDYIVSPSPGVFEVRQ